MSSQNHVLLLFLLLLLNTIIFFNKLILNIDRKKKETLNPSKRYVEK